jgi:hypothetical protein
LASLTLQFFGYVFDAVWHGLMSPGAEPTTVPEMVRHLATVHLPLYVGAASVLVSTAWVLAHQIRRSATGIAWPIAVVGAALSAAAEAWHAYAHLRMDIHSAPIAGVLSVIGFLVAVVGASLSRAHHGRRTTESISGRRAA